MEALEQDIRSTQTHIIDWLGQYEKASDEILKHNYTLQLHQILDGISSFDPTKIKELENSQDQVVRKYISTIADRIQSFEEDKKKIPVQSIDKIEKTNVKVEQVSKRQPRISDKKKQEKGDGFFNSVIKRFASKEKKSSEIILPDEEPNCYYDPVTKSYIFEGQEPQAPKVIAKPPTAVEKKKPDQIKKSLVTKEEKELDVMTAPPAFRRKSTPAGAPKAVKSKLKEQIEAPVVEQPMNFVKLVSKINQQYTNLLDKVVRGIYQDQTSIKQQQNSQILAQLVKFTKQTLQNSQQINQIEQNMFTKLNKHQSSLTLGIMQKIVRQMSDSSQIYSSMFQKLDYFSSNNHPKTVVQKEIVYTSSNNHEDNEQIQQLKESLEQLRKQKQELNGILKNNEIQFMQLQKDHEHKSQQIIKFQEEEASHRDEIHKLQTQINKLEQQNELRKKQMIEMSKRYEKQLSQTNAKFAAVQSQHLLQIEELKSQAYQHQQERTKLERTLKATEASLKSSQQIATAEQIKEKSKIQAQMKNYEEKQKLYIKSIKKIYENEQINHEMEEALYQENQLLSAILEKQLEISKNPESEEIYSFSKIEDQAVHTHSAIIFELSEIVNSITETHLERLDNFNRNYCNLHKKYIQSKNTINKIKSTASNENVSLNRSVSRLKNLVETYKQAKEQAEDKNSQLELQCDKLRKKLKHCKEEDQFNKSYLSKIKSSSFNNQNESMISLQEDKEQLVDKVNQMEKELQRKGENLTKLQNDLEDLLENYQKNQKKLIDLERTNNQTKKQIRILREEKDELTNKVKLYELKLLNQKEKNEEILGRQDLRIKNIESNFEKKIKLVKIELEESQRREQALKQELHEVRTKYDSKLSHLQEYHVSKERQIDEIARQKQRQNEELLLLLDESNQKIEQMETENNELKTAKDLLLRKEEELQLKMSNIIDQQRHQLEKIRKSQDSLNQIIHSFANKHINLKEQQNQYRTDYRDRIESLRSDLLASERSSEELALQLEYYSEEIAKLNQKIASYEESSFKKREEDRAAVRNYQIQNDKLNELVVCLQDELEVKKNQIGEVQTLLESMEDQIKGFNQEAEDLRKELHEYSRLVSAKDKEIHHRDRRIQELASKSTILQYQEEEIRILNEQIQTKDDEITELKSGIEQLIKEISDEDNIKEEFNRLNSKYSQIISQRAELRLALQAKERQISSFGENLVAINADLQAKIAENELLQQRLSENEILQQNIEELNEVLQILNSKVEEKQESIIHLQKDVYNKETKIIELQKSLNQKDEELLQLIMKAQTESQEKIKDEEVKDEDVENEMEYLLKEVEEKENQILEQKEQLKIKSKIIDDFTLEKEGLNNQIEDLKEKIVVFQSDIKSTADREQELLKQISDIQKARDELEDLVQDLEKELIDMKMELDNEKKKQKQSADEQDKAIIELVEQIRLKDEAFIELGNELEQRDKAIAEFQNIINIKEDTICDLQRIIEEKSRLITAGEINVQQKERLISQIKVSHAQRDEKMTQLENSLAEMGQIIETQQRQLQSLRGREENTNKDVRKLKDSISIRDSQTVELKKKISESTKTFIEKQKDYEDKIQSLEREIIAINSLKVTNKRLQQGYKALEEGFKALEFENSTLTKEKIDLMRSNDYLMGINEKLVENKSPHNQANSSAKDPRKNAVTKPAESPQKQKQQSKQKEQGKEVKENKDAPKVQAKDPEAKGFFGSISSFFLTPTQSERLVKK